VRLAGYPVSAMTTYNKMVAPAIIIYYIVLYVIPYILDFNVVVVYVYIYVIIKQ